MQKRVLFFCIVLLVAVVIVCGCTIPGSTRAAAPAPTQQVRAQDPIVGTWRQTDSSGADNRFRFNADGTYISSMSALQLDTITYYGTWSKEGNNSYVLNQTRTSNGPEKTVMPPQIMLYSPAKNTIYFSDTPFWGFTPYNGDVMVATPQTTK
ncbi:MAG: hypothetical protein NTZ39_01135 [Methanoregula sp.]|nr:hypothetical protein [Methanoregula sp.]